MHAPHRDDDDHTGSDDAEVLNLASQKLALDQQAEIIAQRRKDIRDRLLKVIKRHGKTDRHGHTHYPLPADVSVGDKIVRGLTVRRSARHHFDEDAARRLAERKQILHLVERSETTTYIDQDALWACQQRGLVSADEIDALITTTYTDSLWGT